MNQAENVAYFSEVMDRIREGPAAYCNPEVAHADALFLFEQLDNANRTVVALDRMVKGG